MLWQQHLRVKVVTGYDGGLLMSSDSFAVLLAFPFLHFPRPMFFSCSVQCGIRVFLAGRTCSYALFHDGVLSLWGEVGRGCHVHVTVHRQ